MFLEMKTAKNGRFRGKFAGQFRALGGQHGKMPPKFNIPRMNSFVGFFVTLSIFS